jgi:hypothetical protein
MTVTLSLAAFFATFFPMLAIGVGLEIWRHADVSESLSLPPCPECGRVFGPKREVDLRKTLDDPRTRTSRSFSSSAERTTSKMGLDISIYERVEFIRKRKGDEDWPGDEGVDYLSNRSEFRERGDELCDGFYRVSGKRDHFRAGSYSGYNEWRRNLAQLTRGDLALRSR